MNDSLKQNADASYGKLSWHHNDDYSLVEKEGVASR